MSYKVENIERAGELEATRQWADLLAFTTNWVAEEPNNFLAWQSRGYALRNIGRSLEAIAYFLKGLEVVPPSPVEFFGKPLTASGLWYQLGVAHSDAGHFREAIEAFQSAADLDPTERVIWNDLGVAHMKQNDTKGAFVSFKKAVALDPTNTTSLKNLGIVYAMCAVPDGVQQVYGMLSQLDSAVAREFIANARKVQSEREV